MPKQKAGRKSKYHSHVEPRLFEVECWARDGLIDEQIAIKLGVAYSTFRDYGKQFPALSAALKKGKEIVDYEVENALLKRAKGYEYEELTYEQVPCKPYYDDEGNRREYVLEVTKKVRKQVAPDTTAQIFWLKNRKPEVWRDRQQVEHSGETTHTIKTESDLSKLSVEELKELEAILSKTADAE